MKKTLVLLLALTLIISLIPAYSYAESTDTLTLSVFVNKTEVKPGDKVTVTVEASGTSSLSKLGALGFELGMPSGFVCASSVLSVSDAFQACDFVKSLNRFLAYGGNGFSGDKITVLKAVYTITEDAINGGNEISIKDSDMLAACDSLGNPFLINTKGTYIKVESSSGSLTPGTTPGKGETLSNDEVEKLLEQVEKEKTEEAKDIAATSEDTAKSETTISGIKKTSVSTKAVKTSKGIRISWSKGKVQGKNYKVDYYQIYRSLKKGSGYKKVYTTKSGTAKAYTNSKNLTKGKTYYYKVRGARKIEGEIYYTKWSNVVSKKW